MKNLILVISFIAVSAFAEPSYILETNSLTEPSFVFLHGDTRTGKSFHKYTQFKSEKYSLLFPSAPKKTWHIHEATKYKNNKSHLISLIKNLQSEKKLSTNIVFVGMSTGGLLAADLACNSEINSVGLAIISSSLQKNFKCLKPLKTLFVHGTKDPFIKYSKDKSFKNVDLYAGETAEVKWGQINNCTKSETINTDKQKKDKTSIIIKSYINCNQPYKSIIVHGGGHTWPGVKNKFLASKILGISTAEFKMNDQLINYFTN